MKNILTKLKKSECKMKSNKVIEQKNWLSIVS